MAKDSQSVVGVTHSERQSLSDADILSLVRAAVDAVGGIRSFVDPGDLVVLKPNQTLWFTADEGVTTDPRVVAAMVTLCREARAGHIVVGDSSGGDLKSKEVLKVTGIERMALDAGADEVVGFEDVEQEHVEVEVDGERHAVAVPKVMLEAQAIVNLPKAKTHFEDLVSCCLKNWVGVIYQRDRPRFMKNPLLYKITAALHAKVPPTLNVVDGLWAGEGAGPAANTPKWLGAIVAGADPVAVDATVARLMGFEPEGLKFGQAGVDIGLGSLTNVRVEGANVDEIRIRAKPTPEGVDHFPANVLVGEGVDYAGTVGHFKSIGEVFLKFHLWDVIHATHGRPTFMIGAIEDPDFEEHLKQGPYFVLDDAAIDKYRTHREVTFIPGHPATHNIFPYIWRRLDMQTLGPGAMKAKAWINRAEAAIRYMGWSAEPGEGRAPVRGGELR